MGSPAILTLQFGHYSNFIGTHWWNIQELGFNYNSSDPGEINHDVLYREGINLQRQLTFTPRLLLFDLHGSLKNLPEQGELYKPLSNLCSNDVNWDLNKVDIQKDSNVVKNQFQSDIADPLESVKATAKVYNFEDDVKVWSDFLYSRFHPKTISIIKEYQHGNENTPFDLFPLGTELWKKQQFQEDCSDKIRSYVEECHSFHGFHILTDAYDGFSGVSSACLEHLADDYNRKSVLVFPVIPSYYSDYKWKTEEERLQSGIQDSIRVLNTCFCFNQFDEYANLFVPLCTASMGWRQPGPERNFPYIEYNPQLAYHTSAILATVLDTITMKYRLKSQNNFCMMDLCSDLNTFGRKAAAASVALPFPIESGLDLLSHLDKWEGPLTQSVTPSCNLGNDSLLQHITLRGISESKLKKSMELAKKQRELPAYRSKSIAEMLQMFYAYSTHVTTSQITVVQKPIDVRTPFPNIFNKFVQSDGNIDGMARADSQRVNSIPILAGTHNGSEVGKMLEYLHTQARRIKLGKLHHFTENGIHKDDFEHCLDKLFSFREKYENNYLL